MPNDYHYRNDWFGEYDDTEDDYDEDLSVLDEMGFDDYEEEE